MSQLPIFIYLMQVFKLFRRLLLRRTTSTVAMTFANNALILLSRATTVTVNILKFHDITNLDWCFPRVCLNIFPFNYSSLCGNTCVFLLCTYVEDFSIALRLTALRLTDSRQIVLQYNTSIELQHRACRRVCFMILVLFYC